MPRFTDALARPLDSIKRRPPAPLGTYIMAVQKMPNMPPEEMTSSKNGKVYEKLTFPVVLIEPTDDVDQDDMAAYAAEWGSVAGVQLRLDFIFDTEDTGAYEGTLNRMKEFLAQLGIDHGGMSLAEALSQTPNQRFLGVLQHRPDPKNAEVLYAELGRTAALV